MSTVVQLRRSGRKRKTNSFFLSSSSTSSLLSETEQKKRKFSAIAWKDTRPQCQLLLSVLRQHKYASLFNKPVDPQLDGVPDYLEKISKPMDFQTIQDQLDAGVYTSAEEFAEDVRLVFNNCWKYNQPGSEIVRQAKVLSAVFEKKFKDVKAFEERFHEENNLIEMQNIIVQLKQEHQRLMNEFTKLVNRQNSNPKTSISSSTSTFPQRSLKLTVRPSIKKFTFQDRQRLSRKINKLATEELHKMVDLISSDLPQNSSNQGQLELDLELLGDSTLQKIEDFIHQCKKNPEKDLFSDSSSSDSDSSSSGTESDENASQFHQQAQKESKRFSPSKKDERQGDPESPQSLQKDSPLP